LEVSGRVSSCEVIVVSSALSPKYPPSVLHLCMFVPPQEFANQSNHASDASRAILGNHERDGKGVKSLGPVTFGDGFPGFRSITAGNGQRVSEMITEAKV
jgi:hypothetical protein